MWTDHLKPLLLWVLFFGIVTFTAIIGDVVTIALFFGVFGIVGTLFLAIHTTFDWMETYLMR